ncbi:MAG: hypothetical protein ACODAJ_08700, partial [Planctomycetota bacterium]
MPESPPALPPTPPPRRPARVPAAYSYRHYRTRRRWLIALAVVGMVVFHAAVCVRLLLSPEQVRYRIQTLLEAHLPGKAVVGAAEYELPMGVRLRDIELYGSEAEGGGRFFQAKALRVRGLPLALLRGELSMEDLVFEEPALRIAPSEGRVEVREAPEMPVRRVIWRDGTVHFEPGALYTGSPAQVLRAVNLEFSRVLRLANAFDFEGSAESDLWGRCDLEGTANLGALRLDSTVVARDIPVDDRLRELLRQSARTEQLARDLDKSGLQGTVDLRVEAAVERSRGGQPAEKGVRTDVKATVLLKGCRAQPERFPLKVTGIRGQVVYDGESAVVQCRGRSGAAHIDYHQRSTGLDDRETMVIRVDLTARDLRLDGRLYAAVSQVIHRRKKRPVLKQTWDRCGIQGGIVDLDYEMTKWKEDETYQGKAMARVRDARATYTKFPYPVSEIAGTVRWEQGRGQDGGVTYIEKLAGQRGKASIEITGSATDQGVVDLTVDAVDLSLDPTLRKALQPQWQQTYDDLQPEGRVAAHLLIKGPTRAPAKPDYRITVRPQGASFQHARYPHRFHEVRGDILVDERRTVTFRELRGKLGDIPVRFLGTVRSVKKEDLDEEGEKEKRRPILDVTILADEVPLGPQTRTLLPETRQAVYKALNPQGTVRVDCHLLTDPATDKERHTIRIEALQDCSIRHQRVPLRVEGLSGTIIIEDSAQASFRGLRGRIGQATVEVLEGEYVPDERVRVKLQAHGLELDEALRDALPKPWKEAWKEVRPAGETDVVYEYQSKLDEPKQPPRQRITLEPVRVHCSPPDVPLQITDVSRGVITFTEQGDVTINNVTGQYRGRAVTLSGGVEARPDGDLLTLVVGASDLTLDKQLRSALPKVSQEALGQLQLQGNLGVDVNLQMNLKTRKLADLSLEARLKGCQATWQPFPVRLSDLRGTVGYQGGVLALTDVVGRADMAEGVRLDGQVAPAKGKEGTRLQVRARNVTLKPELRQALPEHVREALESLAFQGGADVVDLTITREAEQAQGTRAFGRIVLRDCSFKQRWAFEEVSGEVRIARGEVGSDGSHHFEGRLHLDRMVVHKLPVTGLSGQFAYTLAGKKKAVPRLALSALVGSFCGGRLTAKAQVGFAREANFGGGVRIIGVDFKDFCENAIGTKYRAGGMLDLGLEFPPATYKEEKGLVGDGWARVTRGELGSLPIVAALFSILRFELPERSLTQAEMKFGIAPDHLAVKELLLGREEGLLSHGYGT